MGFVNMASDDLEANDSDEEESFNFERSVSDSEINYYYLGECGEENKNSG